MGKLHKKMSVYKYIQKIVDSQKRNEVMKFHEIIQNAIKNILYSVKRSCNIIAFIKHRSEKSH